MRKLIISTGMLVRPGARSIGAYLFTRRFDAMLLGLLALWPSLREALASELLNVFDKPAHLVWAQTVGDWFGLGSFRIVGFGSGVTLPIRRASRQLRSPLLFAHAWAAVGPLFAKKAIPINSIAHSVGGCGGGAQT